MSALVAFSLGTSLLTGGTLLDDFLAPLRDRLCDYVLHGPSQVPPHDCGEVDLMYLIQCSLAEGCVVLCQELAQAEDTQPAVLLEFFAQAMAPLRQTFEAHGAGIVMDSVDDLADALVILRTQKFAVLSKLPRDLRTATEAQMTDLAKISYLALFFLAFNVEFFPDPEDDFHSFAQKVLSFDAAIAPVFREDPMLQTNPRTASVTEALLHAHARLVDALQGTDGVEEGSLLNMGLQDVFLAMKLSEFSNLVARLDELEVLTDLEMLVGQIPVVAKCDWFVTGITYEAGHITGLSVFRKPLEELPENFQALRQLRVLYLYDVGLRRLPDSIGALRELRTLDLRFNVLREVPASICLCTALKDLSLSHNQLRALPETLYSLEALQSLGVNENRLEAFPMSICNTESLQLLDLAGNRIAHIPNRVFLLKGLYYLDLSENQLEDLPASFGWLLSLKLLSLRQNRLKTLPAAITNIQNLVTLDITKNPDIILPQAFARMITLRNLLVSGDIDERNNEILENLVEQGTHLTFG
jgi:hypothetical protein